MRSSNLIAIVKMSTGENGRSIIMDNEFEKVVDLTIVCTKIGGLFSRPRKRESKKKKRGILLLYLARQLPRKKRHGIENMNSCGRILMRALTGSMRSGAVQTPMMRGCAMRSNGVGHPFASGAGGVFETA